VLQCVAVCCSVLQCVAVCCSVLQCVAVCCSALQCVHHIIWMTNIQNMQHIPEFKGAIKHTRCHYLTIWPIAHPPTEGVTYRYVWVWYTNISHIEVKYTHTHTTHTHTTHNPQRVAYSDMYEGVSYGPPIQKKYTHTTHNAQRVVYTDMYGGVSYRVAETHMMP